MACFDVNGFTSTFSEFDNSTLENVFLDSSLFHRFFFGKNKVMVVALGKGETDEYKDNLHKVRKIIRSDARIENTAYKKQQIVEFFICFDNLQVSKFLRGEVGVLFTNKTKEEVQE